MRGDDFSFTGTEVELRKVQAKMRERYDVNVRGAMTSARRDQREIETLGRALRWTSEGLEDEADETTERMGE